MKKHLPKLNYLLLIPGIGYILYFLGGALVMMVKQSFGLANHTGVSSFSFQYWQGIFTQIFFDYLFYSLKIAVFASFICIAISYPLSLLIQNSPGKKTLMSLIKIPMFIPALIATLLILNVIDYHGILNIVLVGLNIIKEPLKLRNDPWGVAALIIQVWKNVPFMMILMYSAVESVRKDVIDAARNLGANRWNVFKNVILPITLPSALVAVILVFIRVFNDYVISKTAGPLYPNTLSNLMQTTAYTFDDWGSAACIGCLMVFASIICVSIYSYISKQLMEKL